MPAPSTFVFVNFQTWLEYHRERCAIVRRFAPCALPPEGMSAREHWDNMATLRASAQRELRTAVAQLAKMGADGSYPVPV